MPLPLIRAVLPKVPYLVTSTASHLLSLNPHSQHWDFRTFFTVAILQAFLSGTENHDRKGRVMTVEQVQRMANQEQALDDEMWVSKIKMEFARGISGGKGEREGQGVTDEEVRLLEEMIDRAVRELGAGHGIGGEAKVEKAKVAKEVLTGEWTGWRNLEKRGTHKSVERAGQEVWDEKRKWEALTEDVKGCREGMAEDGVVLWVHGGAYFVCDPHTHRPMGKFLSKEFGGPVLLPRYRLAPQNPFPAALVDTLLSYLYLLYPPSGSFHAAYHPSQIFLGGDSAGGGLSLSFTQLLLWFQTPNMDGSKKTIMWGGQERELGLPRGVLIMSGWVDLARCFPSEVQCAGGDYLPTPEQASKSKYRQSKAWPADPPRTHFYTDDSAITHPLVSPLMAKSWEGCPPMWLCVGDECLRDSNLYLAHRLLSSSVPLHFEKYTNMPHVFSMVIQQHPCSPYSFRSLGRFIKHHLSSSSPRPYEYKLVKIHPKTLQEEQVDKGELSLGGLTMERLREMMEVEVGRWKRRIREEGVVEDDSDVEGEGKDVVPGGAKL